MNLQRVGISCAQTRIAEAGRVCPANSAVLIDKHTSLIDHKIVWRAKNVVSCLLDFVGTSDVGKLTWLINKDWSLSSSLSAVRTC